MERPCARPSAHCDVKGGRRRRRSRPPPVAHHFEERGLDDPVRPGRACHPRRSRLGRRNEGASEAQALSPCPRKMVEARPARRSSRSVALMVSVAKGYTTRSEGPEQAVAKPRTGLDRRVREDQRLGAGAAPGAPRTSDRARDRQRGSSRDRAPPRTGARPLLRVARRERGSPRPRTATSRLRHARERASSLR